MIRDLGASRPPRPSDPAADGKDHRAHHSDRDPAEQPNRIFHLCKHSQRTADAIAGHGCKRGTMLVNRRSRGAAGINARGAVTVRMHS